MTGASKVFIAAASDAVLSVALLFVAYALVQTDVFVAWHSCLPLLIWAAIIAPICFYFTGLYKEISVYTKLIHIPHCAKSEIFYDKHIPKPIDVLLCGSIGKHYPLRMKLREVLPLLSSKYVCKEYKHPGYIHSDSFTDVYLKDFANTINMSKICITCTSKYKYRLGKMVEIPMSGSVLACDLPDQDQAELQDKMIVIDDNMTPIQIRDLLISYLENPEKLEKVRKNGYDWSQKYKQEFYAKRILEELAKVDKKNKKVFVLAD